MELGRQNMQINQTEEAQLMQMDSRPAAKNHRGTSHLANTYSHGYSAELTGDKVLDAKPSARQAAAAAPNLPNNSCTGRG